MERPLKHIQTVELCGSRVSCISRDEVQKLGASLEDTGFVYIKGHGLSARFLNDCYACYERFFSLPYEVKQKYARPDIGFQRGWTPPHRELAVGMEEPDRKENLFFGPRSVSPELTEQFPSLYPANIWPKEVPELESLTGPLYAYLGVIAYDVLLVLAKYIDLPATHLSNLVDGAPHVMRPLYYPPSVGKRSNAPWGGEHVDINFLTILPPATAGGLKIRKRDGEWIDGTAPEGCIIAQVGDELQYISCGRFLSAVHGVVEPEDCTHARQSIAFFLHARADAVLAPLSRYRGDENAKAYPPVLAGEFVEKRLRDIRLAQ